MVQEAKESCYQKWYLPAGKMEPNESISKNSYGKIHRENVTPPNTAFPSVNLNLILGTENES